MKIWDITAIVLTLSALFAFVNRRYLKLPAGIGVMFVSLAFSVVVVMLHASGIPAAERAEGVVRNIDFSATVLHGMLGFLLFAGALRLELGDLLAEKWNVLALAVVSTLLSTLLIGTGSHFLLMATGLPVPLIYCFVFGALISPTDPVAVLAVLQEAGVPKSLASQLAGESLLNDGVAVVLFVLLLGVASGAQPPSLSGVVLLFLIKAVGGGPFGFVAGVAAYWLLRRIDDYVAETLVTLALVAGGYALADHLNISAPIAVVVSGLFIGNRGRKFAMSERTRQNLDLFWELIDGLLNAVLFVLVGLEMLAVDFRLSYLWATAGAIPLVLTARFLSVGVPLSLLGMGREAPFPAVRLLTWGGLRGGLAVAMALSLPAGEVRTVLLAITYGVVVFSVLGQGGSLGYVASRYTRGR